MDHHRLRVLEKHEEVEEQEQIMRLDLENHPGQLFNLTIHGIKCKIIRTEYGYYCGYILVDYDLSTVVPFEPHGGWTAYNGFDCAHRGDYPMHKHGIFRTFEFVVEQLTRIITTIPGITTT
jgi:hypothetical protein